MELSSGIATTTAVDSDAVQPDTADVPVIVAPGPWIAFGALGIGLALDSLHLFRVLGYLQPDFRHAFALLLSAVGGWFIYRANVIFHRAETPFQPWRPTRTIAAQDIYAHTRNPMYQGFILLILGIGLALRSDFTVLMLVPGALLIHHGVVLREERYLERRFGDAYRRYKAEVPRYGWPFSLG